ncbi:hypothetical protein CSKR_111791 [Clonorchis sinensis]|uniref:Uncharacterized protein n=2 Tax=Clonorchis sinensis TaxID=79923 RepID=G7Y456_CLOSI|nr:hypothetical protein CSKR_111791 [Clonorchis sinensis]GAA47742.1 hypothetical protein CLF_100747 [Clonorchis sinensis]
MSSETAGGHWGKFCTVSVTHKSLQRVDLTNLEDQMSVDLVKLWLQIRRGGNMDQPQWMGQMSDMKRRELTVVCRSVYLRDPLNYTGVSVQQSESFSYRVVQWLEVSRVIVNTDVLDKTIIVVGETILVTGVLCLFARTSSRMYRCENSVCSVVSVVLPYFDDSLVSPWSSSSQRAEPFG